MPMRSGASTGSTSNQYGRRKEKTWKYAHQTTDGQQKQPIPARVGVQLEVSHGAHAYCRPPYAVRPQLKTALDAHGSCCHCYGQSEQLSELQPNGDPRLQPDKGCTGNTSVQGYSTCASARSTQLTWHYHALKRRALSRITLMSAAAATAPTRSDSRADRRRLVARKTCTAAG
jgi:hypothetical protein